jgi:hypothetical protein
MMTLCETFKCLAFDTWDKILDSRQASFQLKEETFTDLNVLALKTRHSLEVQTKVFTKRKEAITGADWEWWFRGVTNRWIGFRIQAKTLNIVTGDFDHLHYQTPSTKTYQCDKLITNALSGRTPSIPLYCFYIQTNDSALLSRWRCGSMPYMKDLYGCSLTSAFTVKKLRTKSVRHITDIQDYLKPWHCLVCCRNFGTGDLVSHIEAYAKANFDLDQELVSDSDLPVPDVFSLNTPPAYVTAILENQASELSPPDDDLGGIVVYIEQPSKAIISNARLKG